MGAAFTNIHMRGKQRQMADDSTILKFIKRKDSVL